MNVNNNSKPNLGSFFSKKRIISVSLLFMVLLVSSTFLFAANGTSAVPDIVVGNEAELLNAISTAPNKKSYVIGLSDDIALNNSLEIPKNKNITLVMFGSAYSFVYLIGNDSVDTIIVKRGGELTLLDGIVVTHVKGDSGRGVYVERKGTLTLFGGEISGNTVNDTGGGVYNQGAFKMQGGKISDNTASNDVVYGYGGGVYNTGSFVMYGGMISDNTALMGGGGVYNDVDGSFVMSGGEIIYNTASVGGGVQFFRGNIKGDFTWSGGIILGNNATAYDSVYLSDLCGVFVDRAHFGSGILYLLLIIIAIVVVVVILLVYRSKRRKQSIKPVLVDSAVI